eukprot:scaffold46821_cov19-Tisochrysis_lutea.AAC.7
MAEPQSLQVGCPDCVPSPTEDQQPSAPPPILPATEGMDPGKKGDSKLGWCEDEAVGVLVLLPPLLCKAALARVCVYVCVCVCARARMFHMHKEGSVMLTPEAIQETISKSTSCWPSGC